MTATNDCKGIHECMVLNDFPKKMWSTVSSVLSVSCKSSGDKRQHNGKCGEFQIGRDRQRHDRQGGYSIVRCARTERRVKVYLVLKRVDLKTAIYLQSFRVSYDQKVDIYSLGIVFFEMCVGGFQTGMERVRVLGNLRLVSRNS